MKIIDKYIIKELLPHFFIGLLAFTFLLLSSTIIELTAIIITKGINYSQLFLIISYSLPPLLVLTIPMALLLSLLVGLGRLSADFELIVMRNLGISSLRLFMPVLIFALICWASSSYFMINLTPKSNKAMVDLMYKILTTKVNAEIKPRVFYNDLPNITLYINDIGKDLSWKNVFLIYKISPEKSRIILADKAYAKMDDKTQTMFINLYKGSWHENNEPGKYAYANFAYYQIPVKASFFLPPNRTFKSDREMTLSELSKEIETRKKNNSPYNAYAVEWHKKFSIPFACIVFALFGFIFFIQQMRVNRFSGYSISIFIILLYYTFLIFGERFADEEYISPFLGAWAANIIFGTVTILFIFFHKMRTHIKSFIPSIKKISHAEPLKTTTAYPNKSNKEIYLRIRIPKLSSLPSFIIDRYIIKEFLRYFIYAAMSFTIIFIIVEAFHLIDDLMKNKIPLRTLLNYLKYYSPNVLYLVIPLSSMTAVLVCLSILSRNNEIIAIKANGISLYRVALPIIFTGIIISLAEFAAQEYILPSTNKIANNLRREIKGLPQISYSPNINNWIFGEKNNIYNFAFAEQEKNLFYNFQIIEFKENSWDIKRRIYSQYASPINNLWYLHNVDIYSLVDGAFKYHKKDVLRIVLAENADYFQSELKLPEQMSIFELYRYIKSLSKKGFDVTHLNVDFYHKPSFALASLIMILIGLPFSFSMGKKGALYGIGLSILFGIFYWAFMAFCKSLGYIGILPAFAAAWTPNIFLSIIAITLFLNIKT
jgi:LPS export ABC transporter permease LptG/LPS export ABC transporter permease LptF